MESQICVKEGFELSSFFPIVDRNLHSLPILICDKMKKVACHKIIGDGAVVLVPCVEKLSFLFELFGTLVENQLTINVKVDVWALNSSPLICISTFMLMPYYLDF